MPNLAKWPAKLEAKTGCGSLENWGQTHMVVSGDYSQLIIRDPTRHKSLKKSLPKRVTPPNGVPIPSIEPGMDKAGSGTEEKI